MYYGGVTVNIDYDVYGYIWVEEATVNLYPGAHIINDYYMGDVYAGSGAVLNIYGGEIDNLLIVTTSYTELPDAEVVVYGSDFTVDGVPVEPGTTELFLANQQLNGLYEDGTAFTFTVDCYYEIGYYLTLKLHWVDAAPPEPEPEPDIEVSQPAVDFGQVEVDAFGEVLVTVANPGTGPLTIDSLALQQDQSLQFYTTALQQMPLVIDPNGSVEIGLLYAPAVEGPASATLVLQSDDPDEGLLEIALSGEGFVRLTCAQQIEAILAFVDASIEDGTLEGVGWGRWAKWQLDVLENMLKTAQYLIERDRFDMAAQMLKAVQLKTDSQGRPRDFVTGDAVPELNEKVSALIKDLKNQ